MTLDEARANIGNGVVYAPEHGAAEEGTITSVNDRLAAEFFPEGNAMTRRRHHRRRRWFRVRVRPWGIRVRW